MDIGWIQPARLCVTHGSSWINVISPPANTDLSIRGVCTRNTCSVQDYFIQNQFKLLQYRTNLRKFLWMKYFVDSVGNNLNQYPYRPHFKLFIGVNLRVILLNLHFTNYYRDYETKYNSVYKVIRIMICQWIGNLYKRLINQVLLNHHKTFNGV